jgi:hypothetical protein
METNGGASSFRCFALLMEQRRCGGTKEGKGASVLDSIDSMWQTRLRRETLSLLLIVLLLLRIDTSDALTRAMSYARPLSRVPTGRSSCVSCFSSSSSSLEEENDHDDALPTNASFRDLGLAPAVLENSADYEAGFQFILDDSCAGPNPIIFVFCLGEIVVTGVSDPSIVCTVLQDRVEGFVSAQCVNSSL